MELSTHRTRTADRARLPDRPGGNPDSSRSARRHAHSDRPPGRTHARLFTPRSAVRLRGARAPLLGPDRRAAPRHPPRRLRQAGKRRARASSSSCAASGSPDPARLRGLEKALAFNVSGHLLHTVFWPTMSPDGGGEPEGELRGRDRRGVRLVRRTALATERSDDQPAGLRLGRARCGSRSPRASWCSRSTTTRAT